MAFSSLFVSMSSLIFIFYFQQEIQIIFQFRKYYRFSALFFSAVLSSQTTIQKFINTRLSHKGFRLQVAGVLAKNVGIGTHVFIILSNIQWL